MLHTKFQNHRSSGSGAEGLFKVFTIYGHGSHVGYQTHLIFTIKARAAMLVMRLNLFV